MKHTACEVHIFNVKPTQFTESQAAESCKMEEHAVLTACAFHDALDFLLREPPLLTVGDVRKRGIPSALRFIILLRVPVHDSTKQFPEIVNGLGLQPVTAQIRNPLVNDASFDRCWCHRSEKGPQILL